MIVVGIDPGGAGALAALTHTPTAGWQPTPGGILKMPFYDTGRKRPELDVPAVRDWLTALAAGDGGPVVLVAVEDVGYKPGGSKSAYSDAQLAARVGEIVGLLKLWGCAWDRVQPAKWHARAGIAVPKVPGETAYRRKKRTTAAVAAFCRKRYPAATIVPPRCKVPDDGITDALGIAHWATGELHIPTAATS